MTNKDKSDTNIKFFNKLAKRYDNSTFISIMNKVQNNILKYVDIENNSKILDAGCGTGNLLKILSVKNKDLDLYGIDISKEMLKIARTKLNNNVKLTLTSIEKNDFKDNFFDYIFSTEALHHFNDQDIAIKVCYNKLKKQGRLIITDFDFGRPLNKLFHLVEPGNTKMHTKKQLKAIFQKNNFKNIKQKRINLFFVTTIGEK